MTHAVADSKLFTFIPAQWRMVHYLRQERVVRGIPGSRQPGGAASTHFHHAKRLVERQGAAYGDLQMLAHYQFVRAGLGKTGGDTPVDLVNTPWGALARGRGNQYISVALTPTGQRLARDPMHLVLQVAGRNRRYRVSDVARSAGIGSADVKPVLLALEDARLIECLNDTGSVPMTMWTGDIPPNLRLRTTRKGGTYLARKG